MLDLDVINDTIAAKTRASPCEAELVEAYLAFLNIGAAIEGFLHDHGNFMDTGTRTILARLRDSAGASALRASEVLH